ncbi:MAG: NUDIX hydrolase [Marinilabiliales bacterium]|nr:MAG: NUDIX hydrolase [Marinilabiliales bacterium]
MIFTYAYPRPAVTVDIIVIQRNKTNLKILLIQRKQEPFKDQWALPGGFVDIDEEIEVAAYRELKEETSINEINLKQFQTFGKLGRDPRGRTISIVYSGELKTFNQAIMAGDDAKDLNWFPVSKLPKLAFDHQEIIELFLSKKRALE